jgi:hypothetical protein
MDEAQTASSQEISFSPTPMNLRQIMGLYDRLINLSSELLSRTKSGLTGISRETVAEVDPRGFLVPLEQLYTRRTYDRSVDCAEITLYLRQNQPQGDLTYLCGDVYKDFASLWWTTNTDFEEFLNAVRSYIRSVDESDVTDDADIKGSKEKKYSGVYFFLGNEVKHFPIEELEGLTATVVFNRSKLNWQPRFVRIGLKYADLCYDFEPVSHFPQRAGILTYLKSANPVTDFIRRTHSKYVRGRVLESHVSDLLGLIGNPSTIAGAEATASTGAA